MLAVLQLPLADARPFVASGERLPRPGWPLPLPDEEFVRAVGQVETRLRGGVAPWAGEEVYADARRALRIAQKQGATLTRIGGAYPRIRFRRMLADGAAVIRFEVGTVFGLRYALEPKEALAAVDATAGALVSVPEATGMWTGPAAAAGLPLARLLLRSTSRSLGAPAWWMTPGEPLIVFEAGTDEIPELPRHARDVAIDQRDLELSWYRVVWNGRSVGVWFIRSPREINLDAVRRLRVHLLRLHAERESLKHVLRHLARGLMSPEPGSAESETLQAYLNESSRMLLREERFGNPQHAMLDAAYGADSLIAEGLRASLLKQLEGIRRTVFQKVEDATRPREGSAPPLIYIDRRTVVTDNSINIGEVSGTVGAIGQHATVIDSFNTIQSSPAAPELKEALSSLVQEVTKLAERLPAEQTERVLEDANSLVKEAASPEPRKGVVKAFADQILETAQSVAEVAAPIAKVVATVLALL